VVASYDLECYRGYAERAYVSTAITNWRIRIRNAGKKSGNARSSTVPRASHFSVPKHVIHCAGNVEVREGPRFPLLVSTEPEATLYSESSAVWKRERCGLKTTLYLKVFCNIRKEMKHL
jgi:hypothetical protein